MEERWTQCDSVSLQGERGQAGEAGERVSPAVFLTFKKKNLGNSVDVDSEIWAVSAINHCHLSGGTRKVRPAGGAWFESKWRTATSILLTASSSLFVPQFCCMTVKNEPPHYPPGLARAQRTGGRKGESDLIRCNYVQTRRSIGTWFHLRRFHKWV